MIRGWVFHCRCAAFVTLVFLLLACGAIGPTPIFISVHNTVNVLGRHKESYTGQIDLSCISVCRSGFFDFLCFLSKKCYYKLRPKRGSFLTKVDCNHTKIRVFWSSATTNSGQSDVFSTNMDFSGARKSGFSPYFSFGATTNSGQSDVSFGEFHRT